MPAKRVLARLLLVVGGAVAYSLLLVVERALPRHDALLLPVALYFGFRAIDEAPPRWRTGALAATTVVLTAGALLQLWTVGYEGRSAVIGGIVPLSDSHDYASDALRLVHGGKFAYATRRPLFPALLALLLRATGSNLRVSLTLLACCGVAGIVLVTSEIWRTHGFRSAWLVYVLLYFFERRWAGFVQTEHLA